MIKKCKTLQEVKNEVYTLIQKPIKIAVNRGRNKVEKYNGTIISTHPHLFIIRIDNNPLISSLCCSYKEIICGEVKIKAI
ncbi:MAG: Veg family protein [Clostridia bacterium]|nr:Veg family protein [Clostridia bacterium]